jgi:hypothetical protein
MPTKTDIANMALHRIGAQRIMDLDDEDSKSARVLRDLYDGVLREVSRLAEWQCLKARTELGQLTATPAFGWSYAYQLPSDFIRLVKLNGTEYEGQPQDDHEIEGRTLLTDAETAKIEYIKHDDNPDNYDPLLVKALVSKLRCRFARTRRWRPDWCRSSRR